MNRTGCFEVNRLVDVHSAQCRAIIARDSMGSCARCRQRRGAVLLRVATLQTEWAYRQIFTSKAQRTAALAPWLENYNTRRRLLGRSARRLSVVVAMLTEGLALARR